MGALPQTLGNLKSLSTYWFKSFNWTIKNERNYIIKQTFFPAVNLTNNPFIETVSAKLESQCFHYFGLFENLKFLLKIEHQIYFKLAVGYPALPGLIALLF